MRLRQEVQGEARRGREVSEHPPPTLDTEFTRRMKKKEKKNVAHGSFTPLPQREQIDRTSHTAWQQSRPSIRTQTHTVCVCVCCVRVSE